MDSQDILDTSKLSLKGSFEEQVKDLLKCIRLTRWEVDNLVNLFHDLLMVLRNVWPDCRVTPFGSIVTGLGIKTSDVDIYVENWFNQHPVDCVIRAKQELYKYPNIFSELFAITTAKVPIVKFFHGPTNRYSDVNFSSEAGVRNSDLIACLLKLDIRVLNLAIIVKYWSKVHKLTGTNLLPNYALTLLVLFYLQQKSILPPVHYLQRNIVPYVVNNWNTAFDMTCIPETSNQETLYMLLGDFFKFYANFDFENYVISPYFGEPVSKKDFLNYNTTPVLYGYRYNVRANIYKPLRLDTKMCVQDPFEHCRNCTVMVSDKLYGRILNYIKYANRAYDEEDSESFLTKILVGKIEESCVEDPQRKAKHTSNNKVKKNNYKAKINKNRFENTFRLWKNQRNKKIK